ncbi:hypothetical protein MBLNU459_g7386t1 [Dothideomycetes sp. NU459]
MMKNAFRSSRLIYRAVNWAVDEDYFIEKNADTEALANAYAGLLKPAGKGTLESLKKYLEDTLLAVIICLPPDPDTAGSKPIAIGDMTLSSLPPQFQHHRRSMIGIGIAAEYQGQGYGSEAIEWALHYGFQIAGLHRISIGAFSWNTGAWKLYERLGFVPEGVTRECLWYNGAWHDMHDLGMLEHEWRARRDIKAKEKEAARQSQESGANPK